MDFPGDDYEPPAPSLLLALRDHLRLAVVLTVLGLLAGAGYGLAAGRSATATTRLVLDPHGVDLARGYGFNSDEVTRFLTERVAFVKSADVLAAAASAAGTSESALASGIAAAPVDTSTSYEVTVSVKAASARTARADLQAVVDAYQSATKADTARRLALLLDTNTAQQTALNAQLGTSQGGAVGSSLITALASLRSQAAGYTVNASTYGSGVTYVFPTAVSTPKRSVSPTGMALGGALGLLLAWAIAALRADRRVRLTDPVTAEAVYGTPVLATLGTDPTISGEALGTEPYQLLSTALRGRFARGLIAVSGDTPASAADLRVALALAVNSAADGHSVLVIDADPRGLLSSAVGVPPGSAGLSDALAGASLGSVTLPVGQFGPSLALLAPGSAPLTAAALRSGRSELVFGGIRQTYDVVVVALGPLADVQAGASGAARVLALMQRSDAAVLVVPPDEPLEQARQVRRTVAAAGLPLAGLVLTSGADRAPRPPRRRSQRRPDPAAVPARPAPTESLATRIDHAAGVPPVSGAPEAAEPGTPPAGEPAGAVSGAAAPATGS